MSNPNDWLQVYHQNLLPSANSAPPFAGVSPFIPPSDAASGAFSEPSVSQPASARLVPDHGRVSKPVRRRSRASRKTPTTLLNTDTSNFRAMVQQFTGGPSAPFAFSSAPDHPNLSFGFAQARLPVNPRPIMLPQDFQTPVQQNLFHPQNQQQFMFTLNTNTQSNSTAGIYGFPPSLEGSRASFDGVSPESGNGGRGNSFIR